VDPRTAALSVAPRVDWKKQLAPMMLLSEMIERPSKLFPATLFK
jgi:hypothetical protein